jgi:phage-related protein
MALSEVADLYIILRAVTKPFSDAMAKAGMEGEATSSKIGGSLGKISPVIMGITAATGLAVTMSVKWASDFETQYTRLWTAAGAAKDQVLANRDAMLALGSQTGFTGTQIAEAMYHPISAGLDMAHALDVVKLSAEEARISGAKLDDTTYSLSSVMKAFTGPNGQVPDATKTMALLNAIVGDGDMRFQDFNTSIKNWAPTAASMGISIQSIGAALSYLTDRGNSADEASTRVTMGLALMTTPSAQAAKLLTGLGVASTDVKAKTDAMTDVLKKAHITQNQLALDLQKPDGLYVAYTHLKKSLMDAGVAGTEADSVLAKIFGGGRSDKATMSLMQNLQGLKDKYDQIGRDSTAAKFQKDWEDAQKTTAVAFQKLKAEVINLGIAFGQKLLPYVKIVLEWISKGIQWTLDHKEAMKALAAVLSGVVVIGLYAMAKALWAVAAAALANPWVDLIAALVAGALLIVTHWAKVKKFFEDLWAWVMDHKALAAIIVGPFILMIAVVAKAVVEIIKHWKEIWAYLERLGKDIEQWSKDVAKFFVHIWDDLYKWAKEGWEKAVKVSKDTWQDMEKAWGKTIGFLQKEWDDSGGKLTHSISEDWKKSTAAIAKEWHHIIDDLTSIWGSIVDIWNSTGGKAVHAIDVSFDWVRGKIEEHWTAIRKIFIDAWNMIYGVVHSGMEVVTGFMKSGWDLIRGATKMAWDLIWGVIKGAWDFISSTVKAAGQMFWGVMKGIWDYVQGIVKTAWDTITGVINLALDLIRDIFRFWADLFAGRWSKLWDDTKAIFQDAWNNIYKLVQGVLSDIFKTVVKVAKDIWDGFIKAIKDAWDGIYKAMKDVYEGVLKFFKDAVHWLYQAGKDFIQGFINGVGDMVSTAITSVKNFGGSILKGIGSVFKFGSPSKVMHQYGIWVGQGFINGINSMGSGVADAVGNMTSAAQMGAGDFVTGGPVVRAGVRSTAPQGDINLYIQGSVLTDRDLRDVVQEQMLRLGARYSTSYTPYKR